jgi:hypothetical protein
MSYADRIRAGDVEPWVGGPGVAGAVASAAAARDELASLDRNDPRYDDVADQAAAWQARADELALEQEAAR